MVIGIQLLVVYFGAFDVSQVTYKLKPQKTQKHRTEKLKPQKHAKSKFWFEPPELKRYEWGQKRPDEDFDFGDFEKSEEARIIRPPNVIGAGAKKCGTIAFSTFLALNEEVRFRRQKNSSSSSQLQLSVYFSFEPHDT